MRRLFPYFFVTAFILVALFGVSLTAPMSHDMSCPFANGCVTAKEHLDHWQSAFAAVLAELLVLAAVVFVFFSSVAIVPDTLQYRRYRLTSRIPIRPPLMQGLFSQGILHRKEPDIA
jgi:hypothetical protein